MSDHFLKLLARDTAEALWGARRDSTLFALLQNGNLSTHDQRLNLVAQQMTAMASTSRSHVPILLHGEIGPEQLSTLPPLTDQNWDIAQIFVVRTSKIDFPHLRNTHRLWIEGYEDTTFFIFIPRHQELGWSSLTASKMEDTGTSVDRLRQVISADGLYTVDTTLLLEKETPINIRVRQIPNSLPIVSRGIVVDPASQKIFSYNNIPIDDWSYYMRPYNDTISASVEYINNVLRVAFRIRLNAGGNFHIDVVPAWTIPFKSTPCINSNGTLKLLELKLTKTSFEQD